jgi:hypothetical protein
MIFDNKCGFCGCEHGKISFQWLQSPTLPDGRNLAQTRGLKIEFFECCDCGMITTYERVPVITGIFEWKAGEP